jgi:hypothetical protein
VGPTATVRGRVSRSGAADAHGRSRRLGVGGGLVPGDRSLNDTADLVAAHHDQIRLSAINSGATQWPSTPPRGPMTFLTIEDFPLTERRYGRTNINPEATLPGWVRHSRDVKGWGDAQEPAQAWLAHLRRVLQDAS